MYHKSVRIVAFIILLILLSSTVVFAQSGDSSSGGEVIELPTTPIPEEEIDTTPIPDAEPVPVPSEPTPNPKPLEARGEIILDTANTNVLDTQVIVIIGIAITTIVLIIGIVGGRSGNKRR